MDQGRDCRDSIVFGFNFALVVVLLGMQTEGKVVSTVFHVKYFQHFLSLASLFLLSAIITIGSKLGSILCIFKDPPGILSPLY